MCCSLYMFTIFELFALGLFNHLFLLCMYKERLYRYICIYVITNVDMYVYLFKV